MQPLSESEEQIYCCIFFEVYTNDLASTCINPIFYLANFTLSVFANLFAPHKIFFRIRVCLKAPSKLLTRERGPHRLSSASKRQTKLEFQPMTINRSSLQICCLRATY
jgi:hypothetical protein